jgi:hypothetical protein
MHTFLALAMFGVLYCGAGTVITLKEARDSLTNDWRIAYRKYYGELSAACGYRATWRLSAKTRYERASCIPSEKR